MYSSDIFSARLPCFAERVGLVNEQGQKITYGQLLEDGEAVAHGVGAGKRLVFIEGANTQKFITAYVGCLRAGHVVHVLDPDKRQENDALIGHYRPEAVIDSSGDITTAPLRPTSIHPDIAVLLSTSGSTGSKKLVKLTYGNIDSNADAIVDYLGLKDSDVGVTTLKPFYSYGMSVINSHFSVGATLVLSNHPVTDPMLWQVAAQHGVTNFAGVPFTFKMLEQAGLDPGVLLPSLRFVTQAGGRLSPDRVRALAKRGSQQGWRFFVMYGQTEAAPRMSYLPPERAIEHADTIGRAIPGGRFWLEDENGQEIAQTEIIGELVYAGPNVMAGYAETPADLSVIETNDVLRTGDIAVKNAAGLFALVGRKARFVKPMGVRVSLDELEQKLECQGLNAAAIGNDDKIVLFVEESVPAGLQAQLASELSISKSMLSVQQINALPRLASGKVDYVQLDSKTARPDASTRTGPRGFFKQFGVEIVSILFGYREEWTSVREIYAATTGSSAISPSDNFVSLGGDSLNYVETELALETYLGSVPDGWHLKSVAELEREDAL